MKLTELLRSECIRTGSTVDDKAMALCEVAALAKKSPVLKNISEEAVLEALQERETLGTTAFGHGLAIPHCRMDGVSDFVVGLLTVPEGVSFEAEDGKKVNLLAFIIAPKENNNTHIRLLSAISQAFADLSVVEKMFTASDSEQLKSLFLAAAGQDVSEQVSEQRNLAQIFVQDENVFHEIIETLSGLENISLTVVEGKSCGAYLVQTPLYAEFSENGDRFSRCIVAIVERNLSNEVIRRIETITGSLFECTGVMVAIQELVYSGGSLEI
ncbi:MAG: PTS sugar transporter subunit IIA [Planctomycetota bacterium]|jgi:PTS system nitrogen regulatory IIA component